jgi:dienelactone hydrolase
VRVGRRADSRQSGGINSANARAPVGIAQEIASTSAERPSIRRWDWTLFCDPFQATECVGGPGDEPPAKGHFQEVAPPTWGEAERSINLKQGETPEQRAAWAEAAIASRVPDIRFLLHCVLTEARLEPASIGLVGHSFGGWTALASPEVVDQVRAVVALAPAGSSNPRPGILPAKLAFKWGRDVPTLVLAADNDVCLPLDAMYEIFDRIPAAKTHGRSSPRRPHAFHG